MEIPSMKAVDRGWRVLALAALVAGCDGGGGGTEASVATTVTATSAISQTGITGTSVAQAPAVRVLDQRGDPMAGVAVAFIVNGSGTVTSSTATTDAGGNASAGGWRLGPQAGVQTVRATVGSLPPVGFTATAQARAATTVVAGSALAQTALAGAAVAEAPAVRVNDQVGEPIAGVLVTFAVTAGGGQVVTAAARTNATGVATAGAWTLGTAGQNTVTATVAGVAPVQFTATAQARVPTTLTANGATTMVGLVGRAVRGPPMVFVYDQAGQPMANVTVDFAITSGGGSMSGVSPVTSVAGVAYVGNWILGPVPGRNTLTATVAGLPPLQYEAMAEVRVATTLEPVSSTSQTAPAGTPVPQRPTVRVVDQHGNEMDNVPLTFAVTAGGGTVTGGAVTTNLRGEATVGSWTLGPAAGINVLTVTGAGLAPLQFQALGQVPTTVTAVSPTTQEARVGMAVAQRPSVRVNDQAGQPMAGVRVTFAVTAGGGAVTGGVATTSTAGVATVGSWTLGPAAGQNTLTATVGSLGPVTFNATGIAGDPCATSVTYTPGSTVSGSLAATDCRLPSGEYIDFYDTRLATAQALTFTMSSTAVDSWLEMYDAAGNLVAFNDDASSGTPNSALRVFAPAGGYFLAATSFAAGETGAYQLSSSGLSGNNNCAMHWVVPDVSIQGSVASTDCSSGGYYSDGYFVILRPGQTLTVRMESTAFDAFLGLYNLDGAQVKSDDDSGGGSTALLTYTYTGTTITAFYINAGTFGAGATGTYTLTVTRN
jgi:hypothetical protein